MGRSPKRLWRGKKTGPSPVDRAKLGAKRSLLVEGSGVPVGLCVAGANTNDFKLFIETILSIPVDSPKPSAEALQNLCLDKGFDYEEVRFFAAAFGFTAHIRARGEEAQAKREKLPGEKARRWVVERTHSWFNRFRSLLIRWSKKPENYLGFLHFTAGLITYRAAGLFG